ncbi:nitroreductase family protein [Bacillota bacterium Meth-B3]|nr:nitroreductase family protein [Christensenellaceae bacterium]MEA5065493.1 nitroreductase family protein [Eubacteriales bacterium]MEA5067899.1 nitroreductase family protein [Christensenellaceae bacterium]
MEHTLKSAVERRRSRYAIDKQVHISDERIEEMIAHAVKHVPSPFNVQSARTVLLLGEQHERLWSIVRETLRAIVPADAFGGTAQKLAAFDAGYGTVLFFEDQSAIGALQAQFPLYKDNFPIWSLESNGMLEYVVWTALSAEGLGASLQHYNPLIDDEVKRIWQLPAEWKLLAQMPFGNPTAEPDAKQFAPLEGRFKVFK